LQCNARVLPAGLHLLLVEDVPLIALDGERMLLALGAARVTWVRAADQALQALEAEDFDAAILDLRLGEDTSVPLARRLGELGIPYGFLTGYSGGDLPPEFQDRPIVTKPFTLHELSLLLRRLVGA
jgi:CheY-like chemotaxis protein